MNPRILHKDVIMSEHYLAFNEPKVKFFRNVDCWYIYDLKESSFPVHKEPVFINIKTRDECAALMEACEAGYALREKDAS